MSALLHRALVAFTGMPDEHAQGCTGGCHQGRLPCDCELSCDVAPDAERVIEPPARTAEDDAYRAHALRWVLLIDAMAFAAMGALIWPY